MLRFPTYQQMLALSGLCAFLLCLFSSYLSTVLGISYGVELGALAQSNSQTANATNFLAPIVFSLHEIRFYIYFSYLLLVLSSAMLVFSTIAYAKRNSKEAAYRYIMLNVFSSVLYLLFLLLIDKIAEIHTTYSYASVIVSFISAGNALYLLYEVRSRPEAKGLQLRIEADKPMSSLIELKEAISPYLEGEVYVVDKHFNSQAIYNLARILEGNEKASKVIVLCGGTFDSKFNENYKDLKKELSSRNIEFEVYIMDQEDAEEQHERFILSRKAFKIPPLNIINKKNEHINTISRNDTRETLEKLMKRATKYENYILKSSRSENE
ncbi:MAG: hypothetical protein QXL16_02720 [Candidatus Micrarchaeaceae archaeon]